MKKTLLILLLALTACAPARIPVVLTATTAPTMAALPSTTPIPTLTAAPSASPTPASSPTPLYPVEGYGPANFPAGIDPLTGLTTPAQNLERRPLLIKVENLPRNHRPQYGLNQADLVYEYYTEEGSTRFAAVFYGQDAEKVASIRSARYFDINLVQMYKANFIYGGAYERLAQKLASASFWTQLIVERPGSCPALCRTDPNGSNLLTANTAEMRAYLQAKNLDNSRQNLDGMFFQAQAPAGGQPAQQVFARFSGAIYNRWDYDQASGRYLRFSDAEDDVNRTNEVYAALTDKLTGLPVAADNLVVLLAPYFKADPSAAIEVMDVKLSGSGPAYLFRDGQVFSVQWQRSSAESVLSLVNADGSPLAFKPGNTWFEVMGAASKIESKDNSYRFTHVFP